MLRMKREFAGTQNQILPVFDTLLLLDRNVDLLTPLATQLTYEGLIDEIYGITNGQNMSFSVLLYLILSHFHILIWVLPSFNPECTLFSCLEHECTFPHHCEINRSFWSLKNIVFNYISGFVCSVWQDMLSFLLRSLRRRSKVRPARIYPQSPRSCSSTRRRNCTLKSETKTSTPLVQRSARRPKSYLQLLRFVSLRLFLPSGIKSLYSLCLFHVF